MKRSVGIFVILLLLVGCGKKKKESGALWAPLLFYSLYVNPPRISKVRALTSAKSR